MRVLLELEVAVTHYKVLIRCSRVFCRKRIADHSTSPASGRQKVARVEHERQRVRNLVRRERSAARQGRQI